jgi:sugar lactone lactonase YvrE
VLGAGNIAGIAPYHLYFPLGIILDSSNTLYVADGDNNRVQKLLWGNTSATTIAGNQNGIVGSNASLLAYPNDIAVDSNGNVYVVDTNNNRIQLWYVNASSGITVAGDGK